MHNSYTGRRSGTASTGSAVRGIKSTPSVACRAITLEPGTKSQEELMAELGEGLLVQSVSGLHSGVNPVSGDFSTGAEGLMFRDGQLAEPVREFTIGSTIQRMLSDVVAVGGDVELLPIGRLDVRRHRRHLHERRLGNQKPRTSRGLWGCGVRLPRAPCKKSAWRRGHKLRIDCHLHTMWSGDATTTPDELAAAVAASGIDVVCVTDHSTIDGALELAASGQLGVPVIVGEEMRTTEGELMGLFLTERVPFGLKPAEAVARIRDQGGLVYVPHPFDPLRHCLRRGALEALVADGGIDMIETLNGKTSLASLNEEAAAFAARSGAAGRRRVRRPCARRGGCGVGRGGRRRGRHYRDRVPGGGARARGVRRRRVQRSAPAVDAAHRAVHQALVVLRESSTPCRSSTPSFSASCRG